eukprot:s1408_g10.t1
MLLDWSKAFDKIRPAALHLALHRLGVPSHMCAVVKELVSNPLSEVIVDDQISNCKEQKSGIRQECTLSPLLFVLLQTVLFYDVQTKNLNDAVFLADDEFDDSSTGNRAASSSSEDPLRSLGAHLRGTCQPCVFNSTTAGCSRGDYCGYCHFDHSMTMLNRRVRKRTRDKIKRRLWDILKPPVDLEEVHELLQTEAARHIFARILIHSYLEDPHNFFTTTN